jgi:hypothetical protein
VPGPGSALDKSARGNRELHVEPRLQDSGRAQRNYCTGLLASGITNPTRLGEQAANLYIVRGVGLRIPTRGNRYRNPKARHAIRGPGQMIRRPTVVSCCWDADFALHRRRYVSHLHENNGGRAN